MRNVEVVQQMIDWVKEHMEEGPTLLFLGGSDESL